MIDLVLSEGTGGSVHHSNGCQVLGYRWLCGTVYRKRLIRILQLETKDAQLIPPLGINHSVDANSFSLMLIFYRYINHHVDTNSSIPTISLYGMIVLIFIWLSFLSSIYLALYMDNTVAIGTHSPADSGATNNNMWEPRSRRSRHGGLL